MLIDLIKQNNVIFLSFTIFSILHIFWKFCCGNKYTGAKRLWFSFSLSTLHALIVAPAAVYLWINDNEICFNDKLDNTNTLGYMLMKFMIGYLLSDFVWISIWLSPIETNLHHIVGLLGLGSIVFFSRAGKMGVFFVATEISTIALNGRWFLMHSEHKGILLLFFNILLLLSFFSVRILGLPWFFGQCLVQLTYSNVFYEIKTIGLVTGIFISTLNIYWFILMIQKVINMIKPGIAKEDKEYYASPDKKIE